MEVPTTWRAVQHYISERFDDGTIAADADARTLARAVLAPPFARLVAPAAHMNRLMTIGMLPGALRRQYGFEWTERHERALARWSTAIRHVRPLLPDAMALWPEARG